MLKPLRVEIDCVFVCPSCSTETWHTIRELKTRKHLDCPCGRKTRLEPVHSIEVMYAGKATAALDQSGQNPAISGHNVPVDDFVVSLVALGHRKTDAAKLIQAHLDAYDGDDSKFLTFLLAQRI